jgi:hypothetical protein
MRVELHGTVIEGPTPLDIVRQMRANASPWHRDGTIAQYMERMADRFQLFGKSVHARGSTDEQRASSLLEGLAACGFVKLIE